MWKKSKTATKTTTNRANTYSSLVMHTNALILRLPERKKPHQKSLHIALNTLLLLLLSLLLCEFSTHIRWTVCTRSSSRQSLFIAYTFLQALHEWCRGYFNHTHTYTYKYWQTPYHTTHSLFQYQVHNYHRVNSNMCGKG